MQKFWWGPPALVAIHFVTRVLGQLGFTLQLAPSLDAIETQQSARPLDGIYMRKWRRILIGSMQVTHARPPFHDSWCTSFISSACSLLATYYVHEP